MKLNINYYIDDEEIATISSWFLSGSEMDSHHIARPRNVSVDLKYDVLCL